MLEVPAVAACQTQRRTAVSQACVCHFRLSLLAALDVALDLYEGKNASRVYFWLAADFNGSWTDVCWLRNVLRASDDLHVPCNQHGYLAVFIILNPA